MQERKRARIRGPGMVEATDTATTHSVAVVNLSEAPNREEFTDCCEAPNCSATNHVRLIKHEGVPGVWLCRYHCKHYLGVTS